MRKTFFSKSLQLLVIMLLSSATAQAVQVWNGTAFNVTDEDLIIDGDNTLNGAVTIIAATQDIVVTMTPADAIVRAGGANARLYVQTFPGRKVTFLLTNNLSFYGSATGDQLGIGFAGAGANIEFVLSDNKALSFSKDPFNTSSGGAEAYLNMCNCNPSSTVLFSRDNEASANNVEIYVGPDSRLSYVSTQAVSLGGLNQVGIYQFDSTNSGLGRMVLRIADTGSVLIAGNLLTPTDPLPFLSDINLAVPAGLDARFETINTAVNPNVTNASLLVINENKHYPDLFADPFGTGVFDVNNRDGFILGANATVQVGSNSYLDYVGTVTNFCPAPVIEADYLGTRTAVDLVKSRNASAFIVDGNTNEFAIEAQIFVGSPAAIYFRSGVDRFGNVKEFDLLNDEEFSFLIDSCNVSRGIGNIVFDVEANANVNGTFRGASALQILSLAVNPTGGSVLYNTNETTFPLRTFAADSEGFTTYNKGAFLINADLTLNAVTLVHTDSLHRVYEKDDVNSEPTYVGGESYIIKATPGECDTYIFGQTPRIIFENAALFVHTNVAFTGVDLLVPNIDDEDGNSSNFVFFYNGRLCDDCTGRQMVLGTQIGSEPCNGCGTLNKSAQLDIYQNTPQNQFSLTQRLYLNTAANTPQVNNCVEGDITGQLALHTIYLGWASNISIGTNGTTGSSEQYTPAGAEETFDLVTLPRIIIDGNYFAFATRGGLTCSPATSNVTGQGGIFVDNNGIITINTANRASMGVMVTKSHNGLINLPKQNVLFSLQVGVAQWNLDLNDPAQRTVIEPGQVVSDYTLNWMATLKNYTGVDALYPFIPYEINDYQPYTCPAVTFSNISSLPTVEGTVDQFQVQESRLGCAANLAIDCGWIRELVFLPGCNAGEAPIANVVLRNHGRLGLGDDATNVDSLFARAKLGVNGVTIIADGDGQVDLNQKETIVDNICAILRGPNFDGNTLTFYSAVPVTLRIRPTGILDLTQFSKDFNDVIRFEGNIKVIMEPGATIIGGGYIEFFDQCSLVFEPYGGCESLRPVDMTRNASATDERRARIMGDAIFRFEDQSTVIVPKGAYAGIETDAANNVNVTDICFEMLDNSRMQIGNGFNAPGGIFQVGNVVDQSNEEFSAIVNFKLLINGETAGVAIGRLGMLGLAVGIVDDGWPNNVFAPNDWIVSPLFNVNNVQLFVDSGFFIHNQLFPGNIINASLFAIGPVAQYNFTHDPVLGAIVGGGNVVCVNEVALDINPTVTTVDGVIDANYSAGILSSTPLLADVAGVYKVAPSNPMTKAVLFDYLKVADTGLRTSIRGTFADNGTNFVGGTTGYVAQGAIYRRSLQGVVGQNVEAVGTALNNSFDIGAVSLRFNGGSPINLENMPTAFQIVQVGSSVAGNITQQ